MDGVEGVSREAGTVRPAALDHLRVIDLICQNLFQNNNQPGSASGSGIYTDQFVCGTSGELVCCTIPAADWQKLFQHTFGFFDQKLTVCPPIGCLCLALSKGADPESSPGKR